MSAAQIAGLDDPALLAQCIVEAPAGSSLRRIGLGLSGMYCAACAIAIEDAVKRVPGVSDVQVQAASQRARILLDPQRTRLSEVIAAVQKAGYRAWPDAAARAGNERLIERRKLLWRLSVAAFCMMQIMMITTMQYVAGPKEIPKDLWNLMNWASWVLSLPVMFFSCGPFLSGAWRAARQGRVSMDTPVALGLMATFIASTGASFGGQDVFGHEVYFDSLTMFVTFLLGGRWLESRAREKVTQSLESLCVRLPEAVDRVVSKGTSSPSSPTLSPLSPLSPLGMASGTADELTSAQTESVPISALQHGDRVRVAVGQAFPADGQILAGQTEVDESLLTGESRAVARQPGQMVVAGSLNLGAPVWMSVERLGPDTRYQQIVSLVHQAMTEKPGWMRQADRAAGPFLWAVLVLAAGGALAWQFIDPSRSVWVAVSVLVVTCPCALSLAAPSVLLAAAGSMAKQGLLVRRLDALEALAQIDQVYFDKTGTLTEGELHVVGMLVGQGDQAVDSQDGSRAGWQAGAQSGLQSGSHESFQDGFQNGFQEGLQAGLPEALASHWQRAAALAAVSQHPLSRSLLKATQAAHAAHGADTPAADAMPASSHGWSDIREHAGQGVEAIDPEGRLWRLGARHWVLDGAPAALLRWSEQACDARVWLAARGRIDRMAREGAQPPATIHPDTVSAYVFDETFRPEAAPAIARLAGLACQSAILSGDQPDRVVAAARHLSPQGQLAIAKAHATPQDKLDVIAQAQRQGHRVAVVGDGINDAPVLAKADVSIALDQGAALAQSQADLIVLGGRLLGVPQAVETARHAMRVVKQNLAWAAFYNLACIPLALMGLLPPWLAGLGMALSSLCVVLNALRLAPSAKTAVH